MNINDRVICYNDCYTYEPGVIVDITKNAFGRRLYIVKLDRDPDNEKYPCFTFQELRLESALPPETVEKYTDMLSYDIFCGGLDYIAWLKSLTPKEIAVIQSRSHIQYGETSCK